MPARSGWELYGSRSGADLRTIARDLKRADTEKIMVRGFRRELRATAAAMVPAVRASIGRIPAKTPPRRGGGLRAELKRAVRLVVRTAGRNAGVLIMVDGRRMPPRMGKIPAYMEGTAPRWRHPVFGPTGNRPSPPWATQPAHPYFYRVVEPLGTRARLAVNRVLLQVGDDITAHRGRRI